MGPPTEFLEFIGEKCVGGDFGFLLITPLLFDRFE